MLSNALLSILLVPIAAVVLLDTPFADILMRLSDA